MRTALLVALASMAAAQPRLIHYRDVAAALGGECLRCHRQSKQLGFIPISYAAVMDGSFRDGRFRPAVVPGSADKSPLVRAHPDRVPSLLRSWIDAGAKPDDDAPPEHRLDLDGVTVDAARTGFWLSCRAPRDGQELCLRVKVVDEATRRVVAYDWPAASRDLNGRWSQWKIDVPAGSMRLPGSVSVRLHISQPPGRNDRELDGVIFILEPKQTPDNDLRLQKDFRALPQPQFPPQQNLTFEYVLRTPSDVTLLVRPEGGGAPLFRWSDRDLPAGQILRTAWDFRASPTVRTGWYGARFQCNSRNPAVFQPDMAILFRIVR